jgi:hypothetical protein
LWHVLLGKLLELRYVRRSLRVEKRRHEWRTLRVRTSQLLRMRWLRIRGRLRADALRFERLSKRNNENKGEKTVECRMDSTRKTKTNDDSNHTYRDAGSISCAMRG